MRFPIYPEWYRKHAYSEKRCQKVFRILGVAGMLLFLLGFPFDHNGLLVLGLCSMCLFFSLGLAFRSWQYVLLWVEFGENAITVIDKKGDRIRSAEYRYVRHAEIRTVPITLALKEVSRQGFESDLQAYEYEKLILAYIDSAYGFEDLRLLQLGNRKHLFYWCDEVLSHPNCIAFAYNENAWLQLQSHLCSKETVKI